jgi:NhaP-type Na+/H+ or K+/H+ antiporter
MSLEEFEENENPRTKRYTGMKSIMDLGMGLIYVGVGIFILFAKKFHFTNEFVDSTIGKVFAGLVIVYGLWRIYRGIKKDYFIKK